jgi:thioredoxin reductase (NADPH)
MHRQFLEDNKVTYYNKYARFVDAHTLELTDAQGEKETVTAKHVLIAVGSRPTIPDDISDLASKVITSDDLFFLSKAPGKTLVVGASYVALEGAGFIHGLGQDTTVIVRSVLLRGFDQEMAQRVGNFMKERGIKFIEKSVPSNVEVLPDGKRLVSWEVANPPLCRLTARPTRIPSIRLSMRLAERLRLLA